MVRAKTATKTITTSNGSHVAFWNTIDQPIPKSQVRPLKVVVVDELVDGPAQVALAPRFGASDVGLAKIFKRYEIPRPPVGFWAKLEHNKAFDKPSVF